MHIAAGRPLAVPDSKTNAAPEELPRPLACVAAREEVIDWTACRIWLAGLGRVPAATMAKNMAMIAATTKSSTSVKALWRRRFI
jgi:hypothetical protein